MRKALSICLLAAGLGLMFASSASACIHVPGDLRLINRAIDAKATPKADKAQLKRLRATMLTNRGTSAAQIAKYKAASRKGLDLIGETTVVPHDAAGAAAAPGAPVKSVFVGC